MEADRIKARIRRLIDFLKDYQLILDCYVSDYFLCNHQQLIPSNWRDVLQNSESQELATLLSPCTWTVKRVWPLSLLAFRSSLFHLSLDRKLPSECQPSVSDSGQCLALEHCLRKHVKLKKQHEILQLSKTINDLAKKVDCTHVVDIGAGQGHLCRCLTYGYGLNVTTMEASECHQPKANKFDEEVMKTLHKKSYAHNKYRRKNCDHPTDTLLLSSANPDDFPKARHLVGWIDPDISAEQFLRRLSAPHTSNESNNNNSLSEGDYVSDERDSLEQLAVPPFVLTGLHGCGDLSSTLVKLFIGCPNACALASVGCCYMKLSTPESGNGHHGYPMSEYLRADPLHPLSWEARELGVHFADAYHDRLLSESGHLKSHVYRAALQEIIHHQTQEIQHGAIKLTFKKISNIPFGQYVTEALKRLKLRPEVPAELIMRAEQDRLPRWMEVVGFYVLRLSLAPLVESLILLDRALCLVENGANCELYPVFDPRLSPRNFVLLASK